ncbi:hypothetical protein KSF_048750 [Reticulibacter mediterranei]|uniref:CD-NTase-associated protein 12/Pycsar effector protein TIR domain-containing protein n=1 Tax=Reticulibacter mediterranei TaxID=2778369 RepID=A0A8J3IPY4_9CHLR|nr:nucleotide-binding protein [Reticulibacter mediterranei]GHO94827.1 hypothetical protein KSF_048750 [Reticulibacter mediterranei]
MEENKRIIFYSWQSDLDGKTTRSCIEEALRRAIKALKKDDTLDVEPVIERDTKGVPGSPDIAKTILEKINRAHIFVGDVTIVNQGEKRLTPNPNVVYELAYARRALGSERIIMVMNTAYGAQPDLPFDLRQHRAIGYLLPKDAVEVEGRSRADIRRDLENRLKAALLDILKLDEPLPIAVVSFAEKAMNAIREGHPDMPARVRDYMADLVARIPLIPPTNKQDILDEQLVQAIDASTTLAVEFAHVITVIAERNVVEAAQTVYEGFADILNLYTFPPEQHSRGDTFTRDLAKFLGYELFIMFVALLIQNKRWELLATLLDEDLYARTSNYAQPAFVPFTALCQPVALLYQRNERLSWHKLSLQGNILYDRHVAGELATCVPVEQFIEADYFLFLRDLLKPETKPKQMNWRAWTTLPMGKPASYLYKAVRGDFAEQLARSLGVPDVPTLRSRLTERQNTLTIMWTSGSNVIWFDPLERFDIDSIGSR